MPTETMIAAEKPRKSSRRWLIALVIVVLAAAGLVLATRVPSGPPSPPDAIIGKWEAEDGGVRLQWYKENGEYNALFLFGRLSANPDGTMKLDVNNPDPKLRGRSLQNINLTHGLRWEDGVWKDGTIYDGASGKTYNCQASIKDGKLLLRGYMGLPLLGRTMTLHRIP